jgi:transcriptional regulator with XRE-family HTH domain
MMTSMASGERDPGVDWPLGPVVKRARLDAGWSLREAGTKAKISATTWSSVETGTRSDGKGGVEPSKPQSSVIVAVANAIGMDVNEALKLAKYDPDLHNPNFKPGGKGRPPKSQRAVADLIAQLSPRQYAAIVETVQSMLWPDEEKQPAQDGATQNTELIELEAHPTSRRTSSKPMEPLDGVVPLPPHPVRGPAPDPASEDAGQGRRGD